MKINLTEISESDFKKLDLNVLFEDKSMDRTFGIISNGANEYKLGWQSTVVKPTTILIDEVHCAIGIDLIFVIFNFNTAEVVLKLKLNYFFHDAKMHNHSLYVFTELEVIKILTTDFTVTHTYALPDSFEEAVFTDRFIEIKCAENEVIRI